MIYILSGHYATESMQTEVGDLPVAFIPLSNKRLYTYQIESIRRFDSKSRITITLPDDFTIPLHEEKWLKENNINIKRVVACSGSESELLYLINTIELCKHSYSFIYGESLLPEISLAEDSSIYFQTKIQHNLPVNHFGYDSDDVWSGVFSVSNIELYKKFLKKHENVYSALKEYSFSIPIQKIMVEKGLSVSSVAGCIDARTHYTSERAFNKLSIDKGILRKYSKNENKVKAEAAWYINYPIAMRNFIPQFLGEENDDCGYCYSIEYLGIQPLNEIYVYGRQGVVFWEKIFNLLSLYFNECIRNYNHNEQEEQNFNESIFYNKTKARLLEYSTQSNFNLDAENILNGIVLPSVHEMVDEIYEHLLDLKLPSGLFHGDLCLSNILYDTRTQTIKTIDPRALDADGNFCQYGNLLYDLAKLSHSIIGLYDHIIAGSYKLKNSGNIFDFEIYTNGDVDDIQFHYNKKIFIEGVATTKVEKVLPLLFFSMLPLHSDNPIRQSALLANAIRIYQNNFSLNCEKKTNVCVTNDGKIK